MSQLTKNSTPWILVIISMVLLFLFVGYWNYATYTKEKKQLSDDVGIQLQLAYTEIKDSELILFIRTQLTDSITGQNFPDSISIFLDEHPMFPSFQKIKDSHIIEELDPHRIESDTSIIFDFRINNNTLDSPESSINGRINGNEIRVITSSQINSGTFLENEDPNGDQSIYEYGIKQVKVLGSPNERIKDYQHYPDSSYFSQWYNNDSTNVSLEKILKDSNSFKLKTVQFKDNLHGNTHTSVNKTFELLKEKLIENNLPSNFNIVQNPTIKKDGLRVSYITNGLGFSEWIVDLKNYQLFILNKMIPTLLFSLLLLGMIGLAFWTLLANWIKQNRLVVVKNEFINNMTHELKTPIATVGIALEAISNFDLETEKDKAKEYLEISRNEINRLSLLVDKVLNIAAFDSKEITSKTELVDLNLSINETIKSLRLQLDNNKIVVNYTNNVSSSIFFGNKLHIANVIHNIIDNSIKYRRENPQIDIHLSETQNNFKLNFKDNGQGIPKEYQDKIYDRFFRVPTEDRHDVKGHGLGLNYVQNVIESLGGKISVESNPNQGSEFIITLPKNVSDV
jgi:signal transduction histidine kinase